MDIQDVSLEPADTAGSVFAKELVILKGGNRTASDFLSTCLEISLDVKEEAMLPQASMHRCLPPDQNLVDKVDLSTSTLVSENNGVRFYKSEQVFSASAVLLPWKEAKEYLDAGTLIPVVGRTDDGKSVWVNFFTHSDCVSNTVVKTQYICVGINGDRYATLNTEGKKDPCHFVTGALIYEGTRSRKDPSSVPVRKNRYGEKSFSELFSQIRGWHGNVVVRLTTARSKEELIKFLQDAN